MTSVITRRQAIRLLAAQLPFALAACSKPEKEIVPYVVMPEHMVPGNPMRYATVLPLSGRGRGVLVTSVDGRPTKIEGNPHHPASLGATDVFAEAEVLTLYDPDRSRAPMSNGQIASWATIEDEITANLTRLSAQGGDGLALLTPRLASPTLDAQIAGLLAHLPKARWFAYDPLDNPHAEAGLSMVRSGTAVPLPDIGRTNVILSFDMDFLGPGPDQIRLARAYADRRLDKSKPKHRLIALEASPRQTGAKADERHACSPAQMQEVLISLANTLGAGLRPAQLTPLSQKISVSLQEALTGKDGLLLLVGNTVSPEGHALGHWINNQVSAPIEWVKPEEMTQAPQPDSLASLAAALEHDEIKLLTIVGCNPAYDAPGTLNLSNLLGNEIPIIHAGLYQDETAKLARWHLPLSHWLECWSDLRSVDGTAAICQPLIRPLHASRSMHEVIALLDGSADARGYDLVRGTWRRGDASNFDTWWEVTLARGTIEGTAYASAPKPQPSLPRHLPEPASQPMTLVLRPDPCLYDGSYANNAWLQELPKPLSKQVWGHSLQISETDARRLSISTGDRIHVDSRGRKLTCTAAITPGQPDSIISLTLGLGRTSAGVIGDGIGANAFLLASPDSQWTASEVHLTREGSREQILLAQHVIGPELLDPVTLRKRFPGLGDEISPEPSVQMSLYPNRPTAAAEHAWGMVIDTARCIGCNACMVACQSENNIPVVGPEEIDQGRQMHWLRVDVYDRGGPNSPAYGFQPVPCMHCEKAPCEPVCPVEASVHDGEGLNVQVYNRCIGTRFCEANCPYKVRRFNFHAYADGEEYANLGDPWYRAQKNPDVTVRTRGVMEKCTYCVQRLSAARRQAERDDEPIPRDSVATACQSACPTRAIIFGDLADSDSAVTKLKADPRHYTLLAELNTRPRTTYLSEIRRFPRSLERENG